MIRSVLVVAILTLSFQMCHSQNLYLEKRMNKPKSYLSASITSFRSIKGWKHGFDLGFNTKKDLFIGLFSYQNLLPSEKEKESFQGIQVGFPIIEIKKWTIGSTNRLGLYDQRFFSLLPTMKVDYEVSDTITASAGGGVSDRFPVFDFKLTVRLKNILR